jgi:hypothetical protein
MLVDDMWPWIGDDENAGAGVPLGPAINDIMLLGLCAVGDMAEGGECGPGDHTFCIEYDTAFAVYGCVTEDI